MSAQGEVEAPAPPRFVDYLDPEVAAALPVRFAMWIAEESCRKVEDAAADRDPAGREALLVRATAFAADALQVVKADYLPFEIERCLFVDPSERLYLIGTRKGLKIRVDEDLNVAVVRREPLKLEGPRAAAIRVEIRELVPFPLSSADRKPVAAAQVLDLATAAGGPGPFFVELDAPAGAAFVGGRFDRLRAYSDGKVLLLKLRPVGEADDLAEQLLAAIGAGAAGAGTGAGESGTGTGAGTSAGAEDDEAAAQRAAAEGAAAQAEALKRAAESQSPFDKPGWAASVAPALE